jgi:hypothetical protein
MGRPPWAPAEVFTLTRRAARFHGVGETVGDPAAIAGFPQGEGGEPQTGDPTFGWRGQARPDFFSGCRPGRC